MVSFGLLAVQAGSTFEEASATHVRWYDNLTVASGSATTTYKADGTSGSEILELWTKSNSALDTKLEQVASNPTAGQFSYNPTSKELTFNSTAVPNGTEIFVIYERKVAGAKMDNMSDKYAGKATLYVDAIGEDKCGNQYHVQFFIPKADFNGEFSFEMGDSQSVHAFEAEALAAGTGCGATAHGGVFWTCTVFGVNADVA